MQKSCKCITGVPVSTIIDIPEVHLLFHLNSTSAAMPNNSERLIQEIFAHCGVSVENVSPSSKCTNTSSAEEVVETKQGKYCNTIVVLDLSFYDQVLQDGSLG